MTQLTKNDVISILTDNPSVEPVDGGRFAYYLHYSADQDVFLPCSDKADITFISLVPSNYYGAPSDDETMDYWYRHETEDDKDFMAIVDDLYNQFVAHLGKD